MYTVTKKFLNGVLKGITATIETSTEFEVNKIYDSINSGSQFMVLDCVKGE